MVSKTIKKFLLRQQKIGVVIIIIFLNIFSRLKIQRLKRKENRKYSITAISLIHIVKIDNLKIKIITDQMVIPKYLAFKGGTTKLFQQN